MNKRAFKTSLILIIMLFITMLLVSGGTFAYLQWQTSDDQITALNVSVTDDINMTITPAAVTKTGMRPTNNCDNGACMIGISTVTIDNQTGVLARPRFKLKLKITDSSGNIITNDDSPMGNPYRYYIKYKVVRRFSSNVALISGRFNLNKETTTGSGWYDSPELTLSDESGFPVLSSGVDSGVSFNALPNSVSGFTYGVYVWVDSEYTTVNVGNTITEDKLQNATITVSWSENSTVEQVYEGITRPTGEAYAVYSTADTSLRFYRSETPIEEGSTYEGRVATAVYTGFESKNYNYFPETEEHDTPWYAYRNNITSVVFEDEIVPISTVFWFSDLVSCTSINVTKLNMSNVIDMTGMFYQTGKNATTFNIVGMDDWDTSNVKNMGNLFTYAGLNATTYSIGDLSGWDTSNVTNMYSVFNQTGYTATTFNIGNLSGWDTSKVTDMKGMFGSAGKSATTWSIGNLSGWDTSKVTDMSYMFQNTGYTATTWSIGNLSNWNVSSVTNMYNLFASAGYSATTWDIGNLSGWDTSKVTDMSYMFQFSGNSATTWNIGDISGWGTSNVTDMSNMFASAGQNATTFNIGNLNNWNTSKVTNMAAMFNHAGRNATTFNIGNLNNWNVSNVTNMRYMFNQTGSRATTFNIGNLSNWNTTKVTDMYYMFNSAGYSADYTLDLSGWNVCNVVENEGFNGSVSSKITPPNWDMECSS